MANITDPAKDFADLCKKLGHASRKRGDDYIAETFGIQAWSKEFYELIFCIIERADFLDDIVQSLDMDEDLKIQAKGHIGNIKQAFNRESLSQTWQDNGLRHLNATHVGPILMLSSVIRPKINYPALSDEEIKQLLESVTELESWLEEHQLREQDFIRQAILDGIKQFRFRLTRIGWYGWGYTLKSLKEVISAYMILEGQVIDPNIKPDAAAVLLKISAFMKEFIETTKIIKEGFELANFALKAYGAISLLNNTTTIAGFLKHFD